MHTRRALEVIVTRQRAGHFETVIDESMVLCKFSSVNLLHTGKRGHVCEMIAKLFQRKTKDEGYTWGNLLGLNSARRRDATRQMSTWCNYQAPKPVIR